MVQIGNFHLGAADTAKSPVLSAGEAYLLWDNLKARYDIIMATQMYLNHVHDLDFKAIFGNRFNKGSAWRNK